MHSRNDSKQVTAPARAAFMARFELQVDPEMVLPIEERQRRAQHAMKAHMAALALKSSRARRRTGGTSAEAEELSE
jgi:hypothetical protein